MEGTMNILRGPFVPAILFLLILPVCIWAGTTGKIVGTIQDKETGESMPGVSVMIEGTMMGTSTDVDGYYYIINVPVGSHTLKASMVGYTPQKQVNVKASADLTTTVDFKLSPTVLELPEVITVTAERPMVDKSRTSTMHITTATEILGMPVSTSDGVVVNTAGVVFDRIGGPVSQAGPAATVQGAEGDRPTDTANPGINLRGGRDNEVLFMVDGFSINDPIIGGQSTSMSTNAIAEVQVITGGFNAEYGNAMSGVVNIVTPEGGPGLVHGTYKVTTDKGVSSMDKDKYDFGDDNHFLSLKGTLPFAGSGIKYFFSGNLYLTDDWSPRLEKLDHHNQQTYRAQGKLTYNSTPSMKLTVGGFRNRRQYHMYNHNYYFNPEQYYSTLEKAQQVYGKVTHQISKSTFYEAKVGLFSNDFTRGVVDPLLTDGDKWWEDWEFKIPLLDAELADSSHVYVDRDQTWEYPLAVPDLFYNIGDHRYFENRTSNQMTLKFDITSQVNYNNMVKSGFEYSLYKVKRDYNSLPSDPNPFLDEYEFKPQIGAFYIQDKLEYRGLIMNIGGRVDFLSHDAKLWPNETELPYFKMDEHPEARTEEVDPKITFSPRLGVSHPVTEKMVIFYNYGHFYQIPEFRVLFMTLNPNLSRANQRVGNPDLEPAKTVQQEVGVSNQFGTDVAMDLRAYYKNIYNLVACERLATNLGTPYDVVRNLDYGTVKGLEMVLSKRSSQYWALNLSYTLQYARGTNSDWFDQYEIHSRDASDPVTGLKRAFPQKTYYLDFDRRHSLSTNLSLRFPKGMPLLQHTGLNIVHNFGSGLPYTKRDYKGNPIGEKNGYRQPWTMTTDMTLSKSLRVSEDHAVTFFLEVMNLFNRRNILRIYPITGSAYDDGYQVPDIRDRGISEDKVSADQWDYEKVKDLDGDGVISQQEEQTAYESAYEFYVKDPMNFGAPRQIKIGLAVDF
jgi:outer membrane receptor protein involved in Fe transport